jgi:hypothetical protein
MSAEVNGQVRQLIWENQKMSVNEISLEILIRRSEIDANKGIFYSDGVRKFLVGWTNCIET